MRHDAQREFSMSNALDAARVIRGIRQLEREIRYKPMGRREFHDSLQQGIAQMAKHFGFTAVTEYPATRSRRERGLVDVVWRSPGRTPVAAFEVDGSPRRKSIDKLLSLDVPLAFGPTTVPKIPIPWSAGPIRKGASCLSNCHRYDFLPARRLPLARLPAPRVGQGLIGPSSARRRAR